jgi:hypothetical protein
LRFFSSGTFRGAADTALRVTPHTATVVASATGAAGGAARAALGIQFTGTAPGIQLSGVTAVAAGIQFAGTARAALGIQFTGTAPGIQLSGVTAAALGIQFTGAGWAEAGIQLSGVTGAGAAGASACDTAKAVAPAEGRARTNRAAAVVLVVMRRNRDIMILDKSGGACG